MEKIYWPESFLNNPTIKNAMESYIQTLKNAKIVKNCCIIAKEGLRKGDNERQIRESVISYRKKVFRTAHIYRYKIFLKEVKKIDTTLYEHLDLSNIRNPRTIEAKFVREIIDRFTNGNVFNTDFEKMRTNIVLKFPSDLFYQNFIADLKPQEISSMKSNKFFDMSNVNYEQNEDDSFSYDEEDDLYADSSKPYDPDSNKRVSERNSHQTPDNYFKTRRVGDVENDLYELPDVDFTSLNTDEYEHSQSSRAQRDETLEYLDSIYGYRGDNFDNEFINEVVASLDSEVPTSPKDLSYLEYNDEVDSWMVDGINTQTNTSEKLLGYDLGGRRVGLIHFILATKT